MKPAFDFLTGLSDCVIVIESSKRGPAEIYFAAVDV